VHLLRIKVWKIDVMFDSNWCKVRIRRKGLLAERVGQQKKKRKKEKRQHTNTRRESRAKPRTISPPTTKSKLLLGVFWTCHASAPDMAKVG